MPEEPMPEEAKTPEEVRPPEAARAGEPRPEQEIAADDLRQMVRALGLVPIPEALMPRVLASVRTFRASMRRFDEAGIDVSDVVTAQPFRAGELGPGQPGAGLSDAEEMGGRR